MNFEGARDSDRYWWEERGFVCVCVCACVRVCVCHSQPTNCVVHYSHTLPRSLKESQQSIRRSDGIYIVSPLGLPCTINQKERWNIYSVPIRAAVCNQSEGAMEYI